MNKPQPNLDEPVPVDTYIDALWRAVKAEYITWDELRELQARYVSTKQSVPLPSADAVKQRRS